MFVLREHECLVEIVSIERKARAHVELTTRHLIGEYHHLVLLAHAEQAGYNLSPSPQRSVRSHPPEVR